LSSGRLIPAVPGVMREPVVGIGGEYARLRVHDPETSSRKGTLMSLKSKILEAVRRDRTGRKLGETDAPGNTDTARSRPTGGVPDSDAADTHSTTGTTPNETFVGRASGDEAAEEGPSGAEVRAGLEDPPPSDDSHKG
jgi:hypothetical protein